MQARFRRIAELIQGYGLERVHVPCRGPRVRQENKEDAPARD
jgi:hypothetical protein